MGSFKDLTGEVRGRLTVQCLSERTNAGRVVWECRCECGTLVKVQSNHLNSGATKSCGCLDQELRVARNKSRDNHGMRGTVEYQAYYAAKRRTSPNNLEKRADYYDRGIRFGFTSFRQFIDEVGRKPSSAHSLDRIDNDKGYVPGNVRWAPPQEQIRNQRCDNCARMKLRIEELERMLNKQDLT